MRDVPWISTHEAALVLFLVFTIIFHVVWVYKWPQPSIFWKKSEYAYLLLAFISIIGISTKGRQEIASRFMEEADRDYNVIGKRVLAEIAMPRDRVCNKQSVRTEFSPQNFDAINGQYDAYCHWLQSREATLTATINAHNLIEKSKVMEGMDFPLVASVDSDLTYIIYTINDYNDALTRKNKLFLETKQRDYELIIIMLAPLLLAPALALRITKVTAELRRDRQVSSR